MLSKLQKQKLVMVARKAYDALNLKPLTDGVRHGESTLTQPSPLPGRGNDTVPVPVLNLKPLTQPSPREGRGNDTVPALNPKPLTQPSPREGRGNDFDEWRHAEVAKACGKAGLRCCENHDYPIVM